MVDELPDEQNAVFKDERTYHITKGVVCHDTVRPERGEKIMEGQKG